MTIYLDVVLFENIILNYLILYCTSKMLKIKVSIIKVLISSLIGSLFSILNLIFPLNNIGNFIFKLFISVVMIKVVFKISGIKNLIKKLLFFYLISFVFGGLTISMLYIINPQKIVMNNNYYYVGSYVLKIIILSSIISFTLIHFISNYISERNYRKKCICRVEIIYEGKIIKVNCFLDTGNFLKEPMTGKDVIIVEKNILKNYLNKELLDFISNIKVGNILENKNYNKNIFIIPFSSLGVNNSLLVGFKPESIKIIYDEERVASNALIGIYDGIIAENGLYNGLIGIDIFENN